MCPQKPRLDELLANFFRRIIPNYRQDFFERNRQTDNIIVWLVGISTGFLVLIISQFDKLKSINIIVLKYTVFFSLLTILLGVMYRILFYFCEGAQSQILFSLECAISALCDPPAFVPRDFSLENDPIIIAEYLKNEMNYDCDSLLQYHMPIEEWRDFYNKHIILWKKQEQDGLDMIQKLIADTFDLPGYKLFTKNTTNSNKAKLVKKLEK
ncbi:MAG: hypothetical protein WCY10_05310, partial [Candidatus Omnitrophota bacterium]